ncbi:hypothetical protein [Kribbella alba]|uniref:hypothetical protein n=1 Tax=Kribbella alba TaxID=190197 RepID=UPI0031D962E9
MPRQFWRTDRQEVVFISGDPAARLSVVEQSAGDYFLSVGTPPALLETLATGVAGFW